MEGRRLGLLVDLMQAIHPMGGPQNSWWWLPKPMSKLFGLLGRERSTHPSSKVSEHYAPSTHCDVRRMQGGERCVCVCDEKRVESKS